jgi:hypothetical protein
MATRDVISGETTVNGRDSMTKGGTLMRTLVRRAERLMAGGLVAGALLMSVGATSVFADGSTSGLTLPPTDPALAFIAPTVDQPNYGARLTVFLQATVPDMWNGQPVQFLSTYNDAGGVDVLGLPLSAPKADPNNPNFIYQRFQNGALFYNATEGSTQPVGL